MKEELQAQNNERLSEFRFSIGAKSVIVNVEINELFIKHNRNGQA